MTRLRFFSPGEVIFFGEHSVVYGRSAVAAAITRGITATGTVSGAVRIESKFGELSGKLAEIGDIRANGPAELKPLAELASAAFKEWNKSSGFDVRIDSEIPDQSGLASSAAVSSALLHFLASLCGVTVKAEAMVDLVYKGEIAIQKRGSIIGSACTVNGGFVGVDGGRWSRLDGGRAYGAKILVIDSRERCRTSETTGRVKALLDRDIAGTEKIFDQMDAVAKAGRAALTAGDWEATGRLMSENQLFLKTLGVSTDRIDALNRAIAEYAHGSKITGAGGGGCVICLPKEGAQEKIAAAAAKLGCEVLPTELSGEGAVCRP